MADHITAQRTRCGGLRRLRRSRARGTTMARLTPAELAQHRSVARDALAAGATTSQAVESVRISFPGCTQAQARAALVYAYKYPVTPQQPAPYVPPRPPEPPTR